MSPRCNLEFTNLANIADILCISNLATPLINCTIMRAVSNCLFLCITAEAPLCYKFLLLFKHISDSNADVHNAIIYRHWKIKVEGEVRTWPVVEEVPVNVDIVQSYSQLHSALCFWFYFSVVHHRRFFFFQI